MQNESFADFYEVLQVSPNADPDTIHRVFRLLAQRYHPDNKETGDEAAFKQILVAYRALSDPEQRAAYDVQHSAARKLWWKIFDQTKAAHGVEAEQRKRRGILALLYAKKMHQPDEPGMAIRELEELLGCPREHLQFSLWYLKERQLVRREDNGRHAITAEGVDAAEASDTVLLQDRRLLPPPEAGSGIKDSGFAQ